MSTENEPLLSKEETDALLDAMRAGGALEQTADSVDLTAPDRPLRDALSKADRTGQLYAKVAAKLFLRRLGHTATAEEEPAEIVPFNVFANSFPHGTAIAVLRTSDNSSAFLAIGPALVQFILDARMGADTRAADPEGAGVPQTLSNVDREVLRPFMEALTDTFNRHWSETRSRLMLERVLPRTADMPPMAQFEPLLRIGFRATPTAAGTDDIVFALTSGAVLNTVPREPATSLVAPSADDRQRMLSSVAETDVESIAVLGLAESSVDELLKLQVGDILRLDSVPGQPVPVYVESVKLIRGMPVVQHGNLAIEVTERY